MAFDENREVFAVPGSPLDPRCRGSNDLLRQRAHLTEGVDDVVEVLRAQLDLRPPSRPAIRIAPPAAPRPEPPPRPVSPPREAVDGTGEGSPDMVDRVVERSEEHTSELQSLMRISYAVFCLNKTKQNANHKNKQLL